MPRIIAALTNVVFAAALTAAVALAHGTHSSSVAGSRWQSVNASVNTSYAQSMLSLLNYQRHVNGLPRLTTNPLLVVAAHRHNLAMAARDFMSHRLPGEDTLFLRVTKTGYRWRALGENVGWGFVSSAAELNDLEAHMYHETPPLDGHRRNILQPLFTQVGIDVFFDRAHHKMWFTQDFASPKG